MNRNKKIQTNTSVKEYKNDNYNYVNMSYYNPSLTEYFPATIIKNFSDTVVDNPSEHFVSIIRAAIPIETIPLFNLVDYLYPNSKNPNTTGPAPGYTLPQVETFFSVSFEYPAGVFYTQRVFWQILGPPFQDTNQYEVYTYSSFLEGVNRALVQLQLQVNVVNPCLITNSPYFYYDYRVNKIQLYAPNLIFNNTLPAPVNIWVNSILYDLINTMPYSAFTFDSVRLQIDSDETFVDSGVTYDVITQESSDALCSWNSLRNILFFSNLPTTTEFSNTVGEANQDDIQLQILGDVAVDLVGHGCEIVYNPTSQYRLVNMNSEYPLTNIQIKVFYQVKSGRIFPLFISPRSGINLKLAFINKSLYYQENNILLLNK